VFERFTDRARRVVVLAQEEARTLNHNHIGTEHILLGLIVDGEGVAAKALEGLGISLDQMRAEVESVIGRGESRSDAPHIPFTPRAKKVLELALREALQLGHNYIGTEHVLLGLVREGEGVGAQVLVKRGANLEQVRTQVVSLLAGFPHDAAPEAGEAPEQQLHDEPLCPRCRGRLSETAAYQVLDVSSVDGETRALTFAFCRACGTWLGTLN
jgi:ATP-dependent Clp protease ATP-binding subunit ClpC